MALSRKRRSLSRRPFQLSERVEDGERFDVVGGDVMEVLNAIFSRERDDGVPVGVDERDGGARGAIFVVERPERFWQKHAVKFGEAG